MAWPKEQPWHSSSRADPPTKAIGSSGEPKLFMRTTFYEKLGHAATVYCGPHQLSRRALSERADLTRLISKLLRAPAGVRKSPKTNPQVMVSSYRDFVFRLMSAAVSRRLGSSEFLGRRSE